MSIDLKILNLNKMKQKCLVCNRCYHTKQQAYFCCEIEIDNKCECKWCGENVLTKNYLYCNIDCEKLYKEDIKKQ